MANGIKALRRLQLGREATAGGSTDAASTIWRGMGVITDNRETVFSEEDIGILGGVNRTFVPRTGGEVALEGDATFEQLPHILDAGIYKATPTTDASSGFIYSYIMASQSTDLVATTDLQTYVIEGGDNNEAEVMRYCFVREFTLSGAAGEGLQVSATFEGREVVGGQSFTAGLSIPEVETILVSKAKLYIDDSTGTIGGTLKSATLLGMELAITTGWQAVFAADGRLDLSFIKRANDEGTLQLTFEHNGTATAEKAAWRNQQERAIRLVFEGSALGTTDTYSTKTLIIDAYGKWEAFEALSEQDGNDTVAGTLRIRYSPVFAKKLDMTVVNELSAMP